jgi:hypothetical protein
MKRTQKVTIVVLLGACAVLAGLWMQQAFAAGERWTGGQVIAVEGSISSSREALYILDPTTEKLTGICWENTRNQPKPLSSVDLAKDFRNGGGGEYSIFCVQQAAGEDFLYVFDNVSGSFIIYQADERAGSLKALTRATSLKRQLGRSSN